MRPLYKSASAKCAIFLAATACCYGLNPQKAVTQYTKTIWTQAQGLPQDQVHAIAQTSDGYLWLATNEGLARFDGYEFVVFNKDSGLPANSITSLSAGKNGDLWIGSPGGLTHYIDGRFQTFTTADGLPDNGVTHVVRDYNGRIWVIDGLYLSQFHNGKFTSWKAGVDLPVTGIRALYEDPDHDIWIGGYGGVARFDGRQFVSVYKSVDPNEFATSAILKDRSGDLWMGSNRLLVRTPDGRVQERPLRNGLFFGPIRGLTQDQDGNIWVGTTTGGLFRYTKGHFTSLPVETARARDWVQCIAEDRDGDLWVGMNSGLYRFRDDPFTIYSKSEGLPSDEPTAVYQDRHGSLWIGFQDAGLVRFDPARFEVHDRPPEHLHDEVFTIHASPSGDVLAGTRAGLVRYHEGRFSIYIPSRRLGRQFVTDVLEDRNGNTWIANGDGLSELTSGKLRNVIPGGLLYNQYMHVIAQGRGSEIWAGSLGDGLWRVQGRDIRHFTVADGLSSNQIRALRLTSDGTLWIGTLGGGLNAFKDGRFFHFSSKQGLLSDNISYIQEDPRGWLWLTTSRGISRISQQQLSDLASGRISGLTPTNYTAEDGLRNTTGQSVLTSDGRLWTPTASGLAVLDPAANRRALHAPEVKLLGLKAEGKIFNMNAPLQLAAGTSSIEITYTGIHLAAPERVEYFYKLEGIDETWIPAGHRRTATYSNLGHGAYRFFIRAEIKDRLSSEAVYSFTILPHFYETWWFRSCIFIIAIACLALGYRLHLRRIRGRFALVIEERARLSREIHDTLVQDFVGISSQLEGVSMSLERDQRIARRHLDLAMRMARHSLTEARRAVMDLRASALDVQGLTAALRSEAPRWAERSNMQVQVQIAGGPVPLSPQVEQNLLRITQEAVTNASKHARASNVSVQMDVESRQLRLRITDDGCGFAVPDLGAHAGGHFGLIGMRERAERIRGTLRLESEPDQGTLIEVVVPLP